MAIYSFFIILFDFLYFKYCFVTDWTEKVGFMFAFFIEMALNATNWNRKNAGFHFMMFFGSWMEVVFPSSCHGENVCSRFVTRC